MTKYIIGVIVLIILAGLGYYFTIDKAREGGVNIPTAADHMNATYSIEGQNITLVDGSAQTEAVPGSASMNTTTYFGNVAKGDLNGDGIPDLAFILTQNTGGSGTFYYAVAALQNKDGRYTGTNGIMLGDRIAPQTTEIRDGQLIVNYADRRSTDPMTATPSVGVSKYLTFNGVQLVEVRN